MLAFRAGALPLSTRKKTKTSGYVSTLVSWFVCLFQGRQAGLYFDRDSPIGLGFLNLQLNGDPRLGQPLPSPAQARGACRQLVATLIYEAPGNSRLRGSSAQWNRGCRGRCQWATPAATGKRRP